MHVPGLSRASAARHGEAGYKSKLESSNASLESSKVGAVWQSIIAEARSGEEARRRDDVAEEALLCVGQAILKLLSLLLMLLLIFSSSIILSEDEKYSELS